jgi:hypothetical protein
LEAINNNEENWEFSSSGKPYEAENNNGPEENEK